MKKLLSNKYFLIILAITAAVLISVAVKTASGGSSAAAERGISRAFAPAQSGVTYVINRVKNFFVYFKDIQTVEKEKNELENEVARLNSQLRELEDYKVENERLRNMLELKEKEEEYSLISANVIAKDSQDWFISFTADVGSEDGVKLYAPVITDKGLVGNVSEVYKNSCKVKAIIDSSSTVGAMIHRTKDTALVEGDSELLSEGLCKMTYISKNTGLIVGDIVTTSGLGGLYPKGIMIGKIREVKAATKGISQYAVIEPAIDFENITEVFVIKGKGKSEE